jgi:hypothetical protein
MTAEANAVPEPPRRDGAAVYSSEDIARLIAALRYPRFGRFTQWWLGDGGLFPESRARGRGPGSCKAAVDELARIGTPAIGPLVAALPRYEAAADVLVRIGAPAVGPLIAALGDQDREVRRMVARALGEIGDVAATGPLTAALGDQDAGVRAAVAEALEDVEDAEIAAEFRKPWDYRAVGVDQAANDPVWLFVFLAGVLGLFGWYICHWYHWSPSIGLTSGLCIAGVAYGLTDSKYRYTVAGSAIIFLVGVPLLYGLVLFAQLPLLALGLVSSQLHSYLVAPILGALAGAAFAVLWNAKGVLELIAKWNVDVREEFWWGASFRAPVAFLIAGGFVMPGVAERKSAATIALGVMCGIVAAGVLSAFIVLVECKTLRQGWSRFLWVEGALLFTAISALFVGISDLSLMLEYLKLFTAMAFACALTYAAIYLIATRPGKLPPR